MPHPLDLIRLQTELRLACQSPQPPWGRKQNNRWDTLTNFIYRTETWAELQHALQTRRPSDVAESEFRAYATRRWFNFWSAQGVEAIFSQLEGVTPAYNSRDRLKDFAIQGINFDHKTSVFPKTYPHDLKHARENPLDLLRWFYQHQSRQQRYHTANRLFLVLYDFREAAHWQLRAELLFLRQRIRDYVRQFNPATLPTLSLPGGGAPRADIIWAVRYR